MAEKLYRLTARAQMHGEVRDPGYVFALADGERGPFRAVNQAGVGLVNEAVYVELTEDEVDAINEAEARKIEEADAHAAATGASAEVMHDEPDHSDDHQD